jgi:hypothetical protein
MPFTLSHAAASLPFRKLKPVWPALVIGTFAPDLQYFIWISDEDRSGHHFPDVLLFTLPFAILVLWVFEWIVKGPAIELLPTSLQRRLQDKIEPLSFRGWNRISSIALWISAGIATHVFWDQFTHSYSWLGGQWSLLRARVAVPFLHPMPLPKLLQDVSTIAGLLVLCVWFVGWYRRTAPMPKTGMREFSPFVKIAVVFIISVVAAFIGYLVAILKLANHPPPINPLFVIATTFEAMTLIFCLELLVYGFALTIGARNRPATQLDEQGS